MTVIGGAGSARRRARVAMLLAVCGGCLAIAGAGFWFLGGQLLAAWFPEDPWAGPWGVALVHVRSLVFWGAAGSLASAGVVCFCRPRQRGGEHVR